MSTAAGRALAMISASAIALYPAVAAACPVCAADSNTTTLKVAAGLIAFPYILGWIVIRAVRKVQRDTPA